MFSKFWKIFFGILFSLGIATVSYVSYNLAKPAIVGETVSGDRKINQSALVLNKKIQEQKRTVSSRKGTFRYTQTGSETHAYQLPYSLVVQSNEVLLTEEDLNLLLPTNSQQMSNLLCNPTIKQVELRVDEEQINLMFLFLVCAQHIEVLLKPEEEFSRYIIESLVSSLVTSLESCRLSNFDETKSINNGRSECKIKNIFFSVPKDEMQKHFLNLTALEILNILVKRCTSENKLSKENICLNIDTLYVDLTSDPQNIHKIKLVWQRKKDELFAILVSRTHTGDYSNQTDLLLSSKYTIGIIPFD
ncbi:hypothetical protein EDEG_03404 [Edhazardia aedis USNM 41457]|uniref:Uncharacterized protein n=1 Tax=Edhazardia aedis (strain USNM 41457) TaxID=1003232 RepID=J9DHR9_EDHAE|nr:hypothetical protein EDEG_03404 [Edhazardia aedis USNM 41457]|eukprot:EJW02160.1 hypothetical protein EDEG_03404 [Edhazardia aedis USNM 41457]